MCSSCVGRCQRIYSDESPAQIECPSCSGTGCGDCADGYFEVRKCPSEYIGRELIDDIELIDSCGDHALPVAGGLLDQSAWFVSLRQSIKREEANIEREREKRRKHGRR